MIIIIIINTGTVRHKLHVLTFNRNSIKSDLNFQRDFYRKRMGYLRLNLIQSKMIHFCTFLNCISSHTLQPGMAIRIQYIKTRIRNSQCEFSINFAALLPFVLICYLPFKVNFNQIIYFKYSGIEFFLNPLYLDTQDPENDYFLGGLPSPSTKEHQHMYTCNSQE